MKDMIMMCVTHQVLPGTEKVTSCSDICITKIR